MDSTKVERLKKHAEDQGYFIDSDLTQRLKDSLSDSKINLRVPSELKEQLIAAAKERNIPYQRYIKSILIEALSKEKAS